MAVLAALPGAPARAQATGLDAPYEVVLFSEGDTIRGIVEQYLRDPDLWPTVLALNEISSPAELVPGTELKLPVQQVFAADQALLDSLAAIQKANAEGAQIFAPVEIGNAIERRETAVSQREVGEWRQVVSFAGEATGFAQEALDISVKQRDRSAEAIVSDVQGSVEGRAPAEPQWSDRGLNDVLVEFERLRTLSASTTQVTFRDLSRLRLNPNSNATIQRMRSDPLTGGEVTKVSLVNGDFYALLNQLSDGSEFEIEVPGIESTTNSSDFWIKSDQTGARFVNYDEEELTINRGADRISLGENEGVVIGEADAQRTEVLDRVRLARPQEGEVIYGLVASLGWDTYDGAAAYWLEVASDPGFNKMQTSEWGIRDTAFAVEGLAPGRYHWRVSALDQLGLPGEWSQAQDFVLRIDETPPFLTLLSPADGALVTTGEITLLGASEPDATLELNGAPLAVGGDGSFTATLPVSAGENVLRVAALDPAGNRSERSVTVIYRPAAAVEIALSDSIPRSDGALVTRTGELSVFASTTAEPGAPVRIRPAAGGTPIQTRVTDGGELSFTVPAGAEATGYLIEVLAPDGSVEGRLEFAALRDDTAPVVTLDLPPPLATAEPELTLEGDAGDAVRLTLDGADLPLADGRFTVTRTLEPGANVLAFKATDVAGNVGVTQVQTLYDIEPPEILRVEASRPQGAGGPIEIVLEARDESGLRQAAPFVIEVGANEREGFLRCDAASGICRASLPAEPGDLRLIEVIVEDYAGNEAFE